LIAYGIFSNNYKMLVSNINHIYIYRSSTTRSPFLLYIQLNRTITLYSSHKSEMFKTHTSLRHISLNLYMTPDPSRIITELVHRIYVHNNTTFVTM
jgi:hypothetical protein